MLWKAEWYSSGILRFQTHLERISLSNVSVMKSHKNVTWQYSLWQTKCTTVTVWAVKVMLISFHFKPVYLVIVHNVCVSLTYTILMSTLCRYILWLRSMQFMFVLIRLNYGHKNYLVKPSYISHIFESLAGCENLDEMSQNLTSRYVNETVADRVTTVKAKKCWMLSSM